MSSASSDGGRAGGLLGIFVRHPTAANLLMTLMIVFGVIGLVRMNTQFFPTFGIDWVQITVDWPGASAEDVDQNIVAAIEPEVRFLDNVKQVRASSFEGRGSIFVEFNAGADMQKALSDVETAVGQVTTLPEDSETPEILRIIGYDFISRIMVTGPFPESALKAMAKRIREDLLARGVSRINFYGARDEEILVEVPPPILRRLDLKLGDIANRIAAASLDLPSGTLEGAQVKQLRSEGLAETAAEVGLIEVMAREGGERVLLRDIARISEDFDDDAGLALRNGMLGVELQVQRAKTADALQQKAIVEEYLAELIPTLPRGMIVESYDVRAEFVVQRINLLVENGLGGLALVLLVLFVFLRWRLAFWVAMGIPVSLMATMLVMLLTGQSINMVSLFAMIMALGIVVDDAIVVGEHALARFERGLPPAPAAEMGARRMLAPVIAASLTTVAAFSPILLIRDIIGQIMSAIPLVIISVILASLIECFLVLPHHMKMALSAEARKAERKPGWGTRQRQRFDRAFNRVRDGVFRRVVATCLRWRYLTLATAIACLVLTIGMMMGGRVGFVFFPSPEAEVVHADLVFPDGTPRETTRLMLNELERALWAAHDRLTGGEVSVIRFSYQRLGGSLSDRGTSTAAGADNVAAVFVELTPSDGRTVRTQQLIDAWRDEIREMPGIETLTIAARRAGPPGNDIDVRLRGDDLPSLKAAAEEVKGLLARFDGVSDITDNTPYGKLELTLEVTPRGQQLGFSTADLGRQVRDAFQGAIAKRFARGDEEVLVRVRHPQADKTEEALRELFVRSPTGAEVPLEEVARFTEDRGFSSVTREDGSREISVSAEINEEIVKPDDVLAALDSGDMARIAQKHGISYVFRGKNEEQANTFADMRVGTAIALSAIYIVLAWVFASYLKPLVVMSIIPFGLIGAIIGHLVMGFDLSILSMVALLGLSGILVNDSIILVTSIDDRLNAGEPMDLAIVAGAQDRLRAVILTSMTTIGGLLPLMFETSFQAQFLIPIAITMVFGLLFATILVLILVPCLLGVMEDLKGLFGAGHRVVPAPAE